MSESKKKTVCHKVGEQVEVKQGGTVVRPDGVEITVSGGSYVLTQSGTYVIDGEAVEVTTK